MKKFISAVLIIMLLFSFSACKGKNKIVVPDEETIGSESDIKTEAEPEQTEESHIKTESGKLSGIIHPMVPISPEREDVFENEVVPVSMSVPEGWEPGTLEENGEIYGITFTMPWSNDNSAIFTVYKDTGTTYEDLLDKNSLWVGINEHTYHEASGNFSKGSYIRFDYPTSEKYDTEEDAVSVYGRFYQLRFDGYVADVGVYIRIDSEENTLFDEKICDEFISSIKIG